MANYEFDPKKFEEWKKAQKESAAIQEKLNSSVKDYLKALKELGELQKNIVHIESKLSKLKKEQNDYEDEIRKNGEKIRDLKRAGYSSTSDEVKELKKQNEEVRKLIAAKKQSVAITQVELGYIQKQTEELTKQVKSVNTLGLGFKSIVGALGQTPGLIQKGFGMLKGTGIFEMDKEIRNAVRSMAGGKGTYNMMYNSITKAAESTTMWGVGVKDLAIMQRGYSEAIGKSVMLTEDGYKAMAGLAEGTGLGKEFAVEMAGAMDKFNISAERTSKIVEDTMNIAARMGVNGAAAIKSLQKNLALAQRFSFKGGIAALSKLSTEANKLKLDMEGIAGMAEKVFRPEGAIEMAAELTTMGGKFAALGDPMQLMFKARNDFEGFSKDIGKATAEFVQMDKKTGEFNVTNGLAADRMREISKITGMAVEKLQEMASAEAKIQEVRKSAGGRFNKEDMEFIETVAQFNKDEGGFVITLDGQPRLLKDLQASDIERAKAEQKTLEERAKEARTFDEVLSDLILQFKQFLLPFAKKLKEGFGDKLQKISDEWSKNGFYTTLKDFAKGAADLAVGLGKWIIDNPIKSLLAFFALKAAPWILNGIALGQGFLMTTKGFGGMGGGMGGPTSSINGPVGGLFGKIGQGVGFGKNFGTAAKSFGAIGAGVLAGGMSAYSEYSENAAMGIGTGENIGRTTAKGLTAGAGGWGGAAAGAAIGTALLPGIGTLLGGLIGGIAGGKLGDYIGEGIGDAFFGDEKAKARSGITYKANDGIMFHENDKFLKVNDAMTIAGTSTSGNGKLAQEMANASATSSKVEHNFGELGVKIKVDAPGDSKFWESIVRQPEIMNMITSAVNETAEKNRSGGKPNGSGSKEKRRK
jgi:hypothetical protein